MSKKDEILYELKKQKQIAEKEKKDKENELNQMVAKWQKAKLAGVSIIQLNLLMLIFVCYRNSRRRSRAMKTEMQRG